MCKVMDIDNCEKRVFVYLHDGRCLVTEWFFDEERKNITTDNFSKAEQEHIDALFAENEVGPEDVEKYGISRNKNQEDCIYISRHAFERMKQRNGWNKKTALRMVKRVYEKGVTAENAPSKYKTWLKMKEKKDPKAVYKLYGDMVYIFDNQILITAMQANKLIEDKGWDDVDMNLRVNIM